jgi:hypothetical protein
MRRICATLAGTGSLAAVGTGLHVPPVPERIDNPAGPRPVILKRDRAFDGCPGVHGPSHGRVDANLAWVIHGDHQDAPIVGV